MNIETKHIYTELLKGRYLRRRMSHSGESVCVLYEGNQVALQSFPAKAVEPLKGVLVSDKKGRLVVSPKKVRQQDGRTFVKKTYKKFKRNGA